MTYQWMPIWQTFQAPKITQQTMRRASSALKISQEATDHLERTSRDLRKMIMGSLGLVRIRYQTQWLWKTLSSRLLLLSLKWTNHGTSSSGETIQVSANTIPSTSKPSPTKNSRAEPPITLCFSPGKITKIGISQSKFSPEFPNSKRQVSNFPFWPIYFLAPADIGPGSYFNTKSKSPLKDGFKEGSPSANRKNLQFGTDIRFKQDFSQAMQPGPGQYND